MSRPEALCVYCRRSPVDPAWAPFCGERCKMADLGRWLSEDYRVPGGGSAAWPDAGPGDRDRDENAGDD